MRPLVPLRRLIVAAGFLLCLPGLFLLPARAQDSGASAFTVSGTVLNAPTGQPIPRALIVLDNDQAQLTTGDGTFSFDQIPAGSYELSIRKPGYRGFGRPGSGGGSHSFRPGQSSQDFAPPRRILVGPEMPSLTFRLTPLASISGHLTLSTADPAGDIRIHIYRATLQEGRPRWSLIDVEKTRSDGSWRASSLPPGRYLVQATASLDAPGGPENTRVPVWGFPTLYYPGVTDAASAGVLILKAGQQAQADMTLVRQRFFPVTVAMQGMPQTPTSFQIADSAGRLTGLPVHFDLRTGIATANVPNGSWTMVARAFGATIRYGRADFQVAGAPVRFSIAVTPIPPIPVAIHRDFSASPNGPLPPSTGPGMNLVLISADDLSPSSFGGGLRSDNNQDWEIRVSEPGRYWVQAEPFPPTYVASVTSGGTDLASTPLTIAPGSPPAPVEITLRNDPGSITGRLDAPSSGPGAPGEQPQVWIYAIPLFPTTARLPETSLHNDGQFVLENLAPGSYRVVACDAPQEIAFHSPDGLAAWSGKGQVVNVDPNGTASLQLAVVHGDPSP